MATGVTGFDPSSNNTFKTNTAATGVTFDISGNATYTLTTPGGNVNGSQDTTLTGAKYVFEATGGYFNSQTFKDITMYQQKQITKYDVTGAVEVKYPASVMNDYINVGSTTKSWWNDEEMKFITDSLSISHTDFVKNVNTADKVITVGKLSTLYSDFSRYVLTYFGFTSKANNVANVSTGQNTAGAGGVAVGAQDFGFNTLFSNEFNFNPNNGIFGPQEFIDLIHGKVEKADAVDGSYNSALSGSIDISNITQLLRDAVSANPFGNRPLDVSTNGVSAGFLADDLIFVPQSGISITLELQVDKSAFNTGNQTLNTQTSNYNTNFGATEASGNTYFGNKAGVLDVSGGDFTDVLDASGTVGTGKTAFDNLTKFKSDTTTSSTLIKRTMDAPLLLKLT